MGCDIHMHAERRDGAKWIEVPIGNAFTTRHYGLFGWLAGVRNYSAVPPIAERRDIAEDASEDVRKDYEAWDTDAHSASWLSIDELERFNYDAPVEDRRVMRNNDGGCTCAPGEGEMMTYRDFLGNGFFDDLAKVKSAGAERIIFWFDN